MACIPCFRGTELILCASWLFLPVITEFDILSNIRMHAPASWEINEWRAPTNFPIVIDEPEDFLPEQLPLTNLLLSFAEHKGVVELLPDLARISGAKAVLAPVDSEAWLPRGLARQLHGWLEKLDIACATPKPLCSLTENDYLIARRQRRSYSSTHIAEFSRFFGQPLLALTIDAETRQITHIDVQRDAVCGCARYVAEKLIGASVDDAETNAGLEHHHFPCLASMGIDTDFGDTLMHISGNIMKDQIAAQIKPYKSLQYIAPGKRSSDT